MHGYRSRLSTLSAAATVAVIMAATACGSSSAGSPDGGKEFKVGVIFTLSGPQGPTGQLLQKGVQLWAGSHKTIAGRQVQLTYVDDKGTADGATVAARRLTSQDNVDAIIGPFSSDAATGALPITNTAKKIEVPMTAYQPAHTPSQFPYAFPVQYSDVDAGKLAIIGAQAVHTTKLAILSVSNGFGTKTQAEVSNAAKDAGVNVVSTLQYPVNATDLSTEVSKVKAAGADAIIVNSLANSDYRLIFAAMAAAGYQVPVIGGSPAADPSVVASIPAEYRQYLWVTSIAASVIKPVSPQVQEFSKEWTQANGQPPITNVATLGAGYDAMSVLDWAYSGPDNSSADKIENFVEGKKNFAGVQGEYTFTHDFRGLMTNQAGTAQAVSFDGGTFTGVK